MSEINNLRTLAGVQYIERQWHPQQVRATAAHELAELNHAWQALTAAADGMDQDAVMAEARRLVADTLTAHRSLALWVAKGAQLPTWQVDDGHLVIGAVRVPLTADMLADWMKGEADG